MTSQTVTKRRGSTVSYIREVISELKKVVWLSRREVIYLTGLVLIVSAIFGIILGGLDVGFTFLIDKVFLGK